jgi:hypothetical protein
VKKKQQDKEENKVKSIEGMKRKEKLMEEEDESDQEKSNN